MLLVERETNHLMLCREITNGCSEIYDAVSCKEMNECGAVLLEGHSAARRIESLRNPMAPSGIETATIRLVVQLPNQLRHRVSPDY